MHISDSFYPFECASMASSTTTSLLTWSSNKSSECRQSRSAIPVPLSTVPTTANPINSLPVEIISHILESAYYDEEFNPDLQFLSGCALVCKLWSSPSQSLLFRHVFLRSRSAFLSFRSAVDHTTVRGQLLRDIVVRLRVTIDYNHPDQLSHQALAFAVLSCPNLYELDLAVYGCGVPGSSSSGGAAGASGVRIFRAAPSFDAGTLDQLRTGPCIRSLKVANWSDNDQLAVQLLSDVWPSLTAVSLKGTPPRLPASDNEQLLPFSCALTELRLSFQTTPRADFINWLLLNSSRSICRLEFDKAPGTQALGSILRRCGSSLRSLALPSCTSRDEMAIIHGCENLREYRFETAAVSRLLLEQLPESLEHLAFSLSGDTPLYLMVNFVNARRRLKVLTVHVWDNADSHPQLPKLKIACACNGVELFIIRGIRRFREAVRGDAVPCSSYPRCKEPANLRKMVYISRHAKSEFSRHVQKRPRAESVTAVPSSLPELADNEMHVAVESQREKA